MSLSRCKTSLFPLKRIREGKGYRTFAPNPGAKRGEFDTNSIKSEESASPFAQFFWGF